MLKSIQFKNFKILRDAKLDLERFTLVVGPNGSGKSTAIQALQPMTNPGPFSFQDVVTAGLSVNGDSRVEIVLRWMKPYEGIVTTTCWMPNHGPERRFYNDVVGQGFSGGPEQALLAELARIRIYS